MTATPTRSEARPPLALSPTQRVGIIAGAGVLPRIVASMLSEAGHNPLVILISGETDADFSGFETDFLELEDIGGVVPLCRRHGVTHLVLAGGISRRPHWRKLHWNAALLRFVPKALTALARGDDGLLRAVIAIIEKSGIKVVGAHEVVPGLLAEEGLVTRIGPNAAERRNIAAAQAAARAIGALDIGQAAVAIGGRAVALEGVEGTDGLLQRVAALRENGRIASAKGGVLVKCSKPGQESRADLPAIGPATVDAVHAAGLAGIAVEAGRSLVLDRDETVGRADAAGIFIFGFPPEAS